MRFYHIGEVTTTEPDDYAPMEPDEFVITEPDEESITAEPEEGITTAPDEGPVFVGSVVLNPEWSETLLVWTPVRGNQFSILALPNDLERLPMNHLRFINTTRSRIALQTREGEGRLLRPGEQYILNTRDTEAIRFWAAMEVDGDVGGRISNVAEMRSEMRRTVFLTFSSSAATGNDPTMPPQFGFFIMTHD